MRNLKESIRAEARTRLRDRASDIAHQGPRIAETVWTLPELERARSVLLYASMSEEVPTDLIAAEARRRGIEVVYPRCLPGEPAMTLHPVTSTGDLSSGGRFGIREPAPDCPSVEVATIDVALIPGLAWDRAGRRLGRGGGYYDRLLAAPAWRALRCGLFFSFQEFPELPEDSWDIPLDVVVTEGEVVRIGRVGRSGALEA